jgi:hypothetical protein
MPRTTRQVIEGALRLFEIYGELHVKRKADLVDAIAENTRQSPESAIAAFNLLHEVTGEQDLRGLTADEARSVLKTILEYLGP